MGERRYSSIQLTFTAKENLRKKKRNNETYEQYLRRRGML
jgi:hypothetical protein